MKTKRKTALKKRIKKKKHEITKTTIHKGFVGNKKGWAFSVYWDDRKYPNVISALYKTKVETKLKLNRYLKTGKLDTYGSAE